MGGMTNLDVSSSGILLDESALVFNKKLIHSRLEKEGFGYLCAISSPEMQKRCDISKEIAKGFLGFMGDIEKLSRYSEAIQQWIEELDELIDQGKPAFRQFLHKKTMVQLSLHTKAILGKQKKIEIKTPEYKTDIPVIVRLSILTLFPLIEALASVNEKQHERLYSKTLNIFMKTLETLPTLSLFNEPDDCLDSFKNFICQHIEKQRFQLSSPDIAQAVVALVGLAISRGKSTQLFHLVDVLFKIHINQVESGYPQYQLSIGHILEQLSKYNENVEYSLPINLIENFWIVEPLELPHLLLHCNITESNNNNTIDAINRILHNNLLTSEDISVYLPFLKECGLTSAIASNGRYLYVHSKQGLSKIGTGINGSIRGHVYVFDPNFYPNNSNWSSLVNVEGKLYFWSPQLSFSICKNVNENLSSKIQANFITDYTTQRNNEHTYQQLLIQPNSENSFFGHPSFFHVLVVLSDDTLQIEGLIRLENSVISQESRLITDGRFIYLIGKQVNVNHTVDLRSDSRKIQTVNASSTFSNNAEFDLYSNYTSDDLDDPDDQALEPSYNLMDTDSGVISDDNDEKEECEQEDRRGMYLGIRYMLEDLNNESNINFYKRRNSSNNDQNSEENNPRLLTVNNIEPVEKEKRGACLTHSRYNMEVYNVLDVSLEPSTMFTNISAISRVELLKSDPLALFKGSALTKHSQHKKDKGSGYTCFNSGSNSIKLFVDEHFGKIAFYTNGHHIAALIPDCQTIKKNSSNYAFQSAQIFSITDGSHLADITLKGVQSNTTGPSYFSINNTGFIRLKTMNYGAPTFTYDLNSDTIWGYQSSYNRCSHFCNTGVSIFYRANANDEMICESDSLTPEPDYPPFSPEYILTKFNLDLSRGQTNEAFNTKPVTKALTAFESIVVILTHLHKFSRYHYAGVIERMPDENFLNTQFPINELISELDPSIFVYMLSIIEHCSYLLETQPTDKDLVAYIILSTFRLMKINLHDILLARHCLDILKEDDHLQCVFRLKDILLRFIDRVPVMDNPISEQLIIKEVSDLIVIGFEIFFEPSQQLEFLFSLFRKSKSKSSFQLLQKLLLGLSSWNHVGEILLEDIQNIKCLRLNRSLRMNEEFDILDENKPSVSMSNNKSGQNYKIFPGFDKNKVQVDKPYDNLCSLELPVGPNAIRFLNILTEFSIKETCEILQKIDLSRTLEELRSIQNQIVLLPSNYLMLSLQQYILALVYNRSVLTEYFQNLVTYTTRFISDIKKSFSHFFIVRTGSEFDKLRYTVVDALMQHSFINVVLRSLLTGLFRKVHAENLQFSLKILDHLILLLGTLDQFNRSIPAVSEVDKIYLSRLSGRKLRQKVVQTKHPYSYSKTQFKETVFFPGTSALSLKFDPRCCTGSSLDVLQLFASPAMDKPIISKFDKNSVLSYSKNNWPHLSIIVPGNCVTFFFSSNSRTSSLDNEHYWGFRCVVSELDLLYNDPGIDHYLLDLQNTVARLGAMYVLNLVAGDHISEKEKQYQFWLDMPLFHGGLDLKTTHTNDIKWLESFAQGSTKEFTLLYEWLRSHSGTRPILRSSAKNHIESAERYIMAAAFNHLGLIEDAKRVAEMLSTPNLKSIPTDLVGKFSLLSKNVLYMVSLLARRSEIQKEWQLTIQEKNTDFDVFDSFRQESERLKELCEIQNVEFDLVDTNETIKRLFNRLQKEILEYEKCRADNEAFVLPDPYEVVCQPIINRAKFLFNVLPANPAIEYPTADKVNPFSVPGKNNDTVRISFSFLPGLSKKRTFTSSLSHLPSSELAHNIQLKLTDRKRNASFDQRVAELREWLSAYMLWKKWQETNLLQNHQLSTESKETPSSLLQCIIAFMKEHFVNIRELKSLIHNQANRASIREEGLKYLCVLLEHSHFSSVLHQILDEIRSSFLIGGYYLRGIQTCGEAVTHRIVARFTQIFNHITSIIINNNSDYTSSLLALNIFKSIYRASNALLFDSENIIPFFDSSVSGYFSTESATNQQNNNLITQKRLFISAAWIAFCLISTQCCLWPPNNSVVTGTYITDIQKNIFMAIKRQLAKLLELQITDHLSKHSKNSDVPCLTSGCLGYFNYGTEDKYFELLSLLYLIGNNPNILLRVGIVDNLITIIGSGVSFRSQRLILRLLRRLLSSWKVDADSKRISNILFEMLGKWLLEGKYICEFNEGDQDVKIHDSSLIVTGESYPNFEQVGIENIDINNTQMRYSLYLLSWKRGLKRLLEVCTSFGSDMFEFYYIPAFHSMSPTNINISIDTNTYSSTLTKEARLGHILEEMNSNGRSLLKTDCGERISQLATNLARLGATIQITVASECVNIESHKENPSTCTKNINQSLKKINPTFWISGHAAYTLAMEYMSLIRFLLNTDSKWRLIIFDMLRRNFLSLPGLIKTLHSCPTLIDSETEKKIWNTQAALRIIAGLYESATLSDEMISKLNNADGGEWPNTSSIFDRSSDLDSKVDILFRSDLQKIQTSYSVDSEDLHKDYKVQIEASLSSFLTNEILNALLSVIEVPIIPIHTDENSSVYSTRNINDQSTAIYIEDSARIQTNWLIQELKTGSLECINMMLKWQDCDEQLVHLQSNPKIIHCLLDMSKSCDITVDMSRSEKELLRLNSRLYDIQTIPPEFDDNALSFTRSMNSELPYLFNSHNVQVAPTAFDKQHAPGIFFWGTEMRIAEYKQVNNSSISSISQSRSITSIRDICRENGANNSSKEIILIANSTIPIKEIGEYYFEMTVLAAGSNNGGISIGLVPVDNIAISSFSFKSTGGNGGSYLSSWPNNSYLYQANRNKCYVVNGNRKQEIYGSFFGTGNVIGCGWNSNERVIYFTKDSADLGPAFVEVVASEEGMIPAICLSKGVKVSVNFGQEPFKYSLCTSSDGSDETRQKIRRRQEEKLRKKIKEEENRRIKEKEKEYAARKESIDLILGMGYSLKQAWKAMEVTGWINAESAVHWLVENPKYCFDNLPEPQLPDVFKYKDEAQSDETNTHGNVNKNGERNDLIKENSLSSTDLGDRYDIKQSSKLLLTNSYTQISGIQSMKTERDIQSEEKKTTVIHEWEHFIQPQLKSFMENDGFLAFEINEYLQQIKNELYNGNETSARRMMTHLLGESVHITQLPSRYSSINHHSSNLKIDQRSIGSLVSVVKGPSISEIFNPDLCWISPEMDRCISRIGNVKRIDLKLGMALVQFQDNEKATLEKWWFPIRYLKRLSWNFQHSISHFQSRSRLQARITNILQSLAKIYARRIFLHIIDRQPLSCKSLPVLNEKIRSFHLDNGISIDIHDALKLATTEYLSNTSTLISLYSLTPEIFDKYPTYLGSCSNVNDSPNGMTILRKKLLEILKNIVSVPGHASDFTNLLMTEAVSLVNECSRSVSTQSVKIVSKNNVSPSNAKIMASMTANNTRHFKVKDARLLAIIFRKNLQLKSGSKLNFYSDEGCTEVIESYCSQTPLYPLIISGNEFWVSIQKDPSNDSVPQHYEFFIVPFSTDLYLVRWITEFILKYTLGFQPDLTLLFNAIIDYLYHSKIPSPFKQSCFYFLAQFIQRLKDRGGASASCLNSLTLERLAPLKHEMLTLYKSEKDSKQLFSSYLQALIEFMALVQVFNLNKLTEYTISSLIPSLNGSEDEIDETTKVAVILTQFLKQLVQNQKSDTQKNPDSDCLTSSIIYHNCDNQTSSDLLTEFRIQPSMQESFQKGTNEGSLTESKECADFFSKAELDGINNSGKKVQITDLEKDDLNLELDEGVVQRQQLIGNVGPTWFSQVTEIAQRLEILCMRDPSNINQKFMLKELAKSAWLETVSTNEIGERILLIENLPSVPSDKSSELIVSLIELFEEYGVVFCESSFYISEHPVTQFTNTWAFAEVQNHEKVCVALSRVNGATFNYSCFTGEERSTTLKVIELKKLMGVTNTKDLPKTKKSKSRNSMRFFSFFSNALDTTAMDQRIVEYLRQKLYCSKSGQLTEKFKNVLSEIFVKFSCDHTIYGVLEEAQMEELQLSMTGRPMSPETKNYIFHNFTVKDYTYSPSHPSKNITPDTFDATPRTETLENTGTSNTSFSIPFNGSFHIYASDNSDATNYVINARGVTIQGFLDCYTVQANLEPIATWEEIASLGYDLNLNLSIFTSLEDSQKAILDHSSDLIQTDEDIVKYVEHSYSDFDITSPLQLSFSHINPISSDSYLAQSCPYLAKLSLPLLRLRFVMLRQLNLNILSVLPLIDLSGEGILAQRIIRCRNLLFHTLKMSFFYDVLDQTATSVASQPTVCIDRLKLAARKERSSQLSSSNMTAEYLLKNTAFGIAFNQLQYVNPKDFCQKKPSGTEPHFSIKVDFEGENVEGESGPYRQFFTDVSKELTKVLPLLIPCPNAQSKVGKNREKFIVAPSCNSSLFLGMFHFLGQLMGIAIRTGVMLTVDFAPIFWKSLVGQEITLEDIRNIDHSFHGFLKYLEFCDPKDLEGETRQIFEKFQVPLSDKSVVPLKPGGDRIDISYENRKEYIHLAKQARINESCSQIQAIRSGLADVVPLPLLRLCNWQDLEWRVCGRPLIDVELLKRHTEYSIVSSKAPHIRYFWQVLRSFSQEDRRAFVRFAWAQERLPSDDQEFERTQTRMLIKPFLGAGNPDKTFPKADTCFFNLMLPEYSRSEILRERLLFAIHTDADSMDADDPR